MNRKKLVILVVVCTVVLLTAIGINALMSFSFESNTVESSESEVTVTENEENTSQEKNSDVTNEEAVSDTVTLTNVTGDVLVIRNDTELEITSDTELITGDRVISKEDASVELIVNSNESAILGANTEIEIIDIYSNEKGINLSMRQLAGTVYHSGKHNDYSVQMGDVQSVAEGTHFITSYDPVVGESSIMVVSGIVRVTDSMTESNSRTGLLIYPALQANFTNNDNETSQVLINDISINNLVANSDPSIIEALLRNKRNIDQENKDLIDRLEQDGDILETIGLNADAYMRYQENLNNTINSIATEAFNQNKLSKEEINRINEQINVDKTSPMRDVFDERKASALEEIRRIQQMKQAQEKQRQARKQQQNQLNNLLQQIKKAQEQQKEQNEKQINQKQQQAEEQFKETLTDQQKQRLREQREEQRKEQERQEKLRLEKEREKQLQLEREEAIKADIQSITGQKLQLENGIKILDLNDFFKIKQSLTYAIQSNDPSVAEGEIDGTQLKIVPQKNGQATFTLSVGLGSFKTTKKFSVLVESKPLQAPKAVHFTDIDPLQNKIRGTLTVEKAVEESNISHYSLYWANSSQQKMGEAIKKITKTGEDLTYTFPNGTDIPEGATGIIAVSINNFGQSEKYVYTSVQDLSEPWIQKTIPDTRLYLYEPSHFEFVNYFVDPYGQSIDGFNQDYSFEIRSGDATIAEAGIDGNVFYLNGFSEGSTKITVSLLDRETNEQVLSTTFDVNVNLLPLPDAPTTIQFHDENPLSGEFSGTVSVTKALDETYVSSYELYWVNDEAQKIGDPLTIWSPTGTDLEFHLADTQMPEGATGLLVQSRNSTGVSEGNAYVEVEDYKSVWINNTIPDQVITEGSIQGIEIPDVFMDEYGEPISEYSNSYKLIAVSSDESIARAYNDGGIFIEGNGKGVANVIIQVTSWQSTEILASTTFEVTVE